MSKRLLWGAALLLCMIIPAFAQEWGPDVQLTIELDSIDYYFLIAAYGNYVNVVWEGSVIDPGYYGDYHRRSADNGETWGPQTEMPDWYVPSSMAAWGNNVHLLTGTYYSKSQDNGETWEEPVKLSDSLGFAESYVAERVAAYGSYVHTAWIKWNQNEDTYEVRYRRSTNQGESWEEIASLAEGSIGSYYPMSLAIAAHEDNVYLAWLDENDGSEGRLDNVLFRRSTDAGENWEPAADLTHHVNDSTKARYPSLAAWEETVHLVWEDLTNYPDTIGTLKYVRSADQGANWNSEVSFAEVDNEYPWFPTIIASLAAWGNNVHVAWDEDRTGSHGIYYKLSGDGGLTWGEEETLVLHDTAHAFRPHLAAYEGNIHMMWSDTRNYKEELFYKRGTLTTGVHEQSVTGPFFELASPIGRQVVLHYSDCIEGFHSVIFDAAGRKVDEVNSNPKSGTIEWGEGFNSGVYFVRVEDGSSSSVHKVILIR